MKACQDEFAPPLEDYALIGDCRGAALISRAGAIDWLCWPRFDSPACFAALLGRSEHGRWRIGAADVAATVTRRYRPGTLILETQFETARGAASVIDFMDLEGEPPGNAPCVIRIVEGRRGRLAMRADLTLRFEYGTVVPRIAPLPDGAGMRATAGPDSVVLRGDVPMRDGDGELDADFSVAAGERIAFSLTHATAHPPPAPARDPLVALREAEAFWTGWSGRCTLDGLADYPWREAVARSLLTLKALTFAPTGGMVAAPTSSLPERLGGTRNWDYRYCWLRDSSLAARTLLRSGYREEAGAWFAWLRRAVAGAPERIRTLYGVAGERHVPERTVEGLPGYQGAAPVRVGNAAAVQLQLDVYGELMDTQWLAARAGVLEPASMWDMTCGLIAQLAALWREPDEGIWEVRGGRRHFTLSKVMAWVAVDRAIRMAESFALAAPLAAWRAMREEIRASVLAYGTNPARGCLVQVYGRQAVDASLLLVAPTGFLPQGDPLVAGTVAAIERELMRDGLPLRYRPDAADDGLPQGEGRFLACGFWYVDNLVLLGRHAEARAAFAHLLALANDVGLLAEEYDPEAGRLVGNFPQALSHLALVSSALTLGPDLNGPARLIGRAQPV